MFEGSSTYVENPSNLSYKLDKIRFSSSSLEIPERLQLPRLDRIAQRAERLAQEPQALRNMQRFLTGALIVGILGEYRSYKALSPEMRRELEDAISIFIGPLRLRTEKLKGRLDLLDEGEVFEQKVSSAKAQQELVREVLYITDDDENRVATDEEVMSTFWRLSMLKILSESRLGRQLSIERWFVGVKRQVGLMKMLLDHPDVLKVLHVEPSDFDIIALDMHGIDMVLALRNENNKSRYDMVCIDAKPHGNRTGFDVRLGNAGLHQITQARLEQYKLKVKKECLGAGDSIFINPQKMVMQIGIDKLNSFASGESIGYLQRLIDRRDRVSMQRMIDEFGRIEDGYSDLAIAQIRNKLLR